MNQGDRFGHWTVLRLAGRYALCRCDCGREALVPKNRLHTGRSRSCGCARAEAHRGTLAGRRFGRWTAIEERGARTLCRCDCGTQRLVQTSGLLNNRTRSCGCTHARGTRIERGDFRLRLVHFATEKERLT